MSITTIALANLVEDLDMYPRTQVSQVNVANIADALRAGKTIPPPIVDRKSKRIVDGVHRCRAYRKVFGPDIAIEVDMRSFGSDTDIFTTAVTCNVGHGLQFQEFEKRRITLRLQDMGADDTTIGAVLNIPPDRVRKITLHTATTIIGGGKLKLEPLKRPLFHKEGQRFTPEQVAAIRTAPGTSYGLLVRQLREAIEHQFLDLTDPKLVAALAALHTDIGVLLAARTA